MTTETQAPSGQHGAGKVCRVTLGLGLTTFGGPIAHLGYFERAYVRERQWLSVDEYAGLVALCQMLPGPASSQVGLLVGLRRAGWAGAVAAWAGFTLPSALVLFVFALLAPRMHKPVIVAGLHGLQLVAVSVVAQAVWSMAQKLCPDRRRAGLALAASTLMLVVGGAAVQILALVLGAIGGAALPLSPGPTHAASNASKSMSRRDRTGAVPGDAGGSADCWGSGTGLSAGSGEHFLPGVWGATERKNYVRPCRATYRGASPFCDIHLRQESAQGNRVN